MQRPIVDDAGNGWVVSLSGRRSHYVSDEILLEFRRDDDSERRYVKFSPRGPRAPELALERLSDGMLARLLASSGPSSTAPDGGYRRQ